LRRELAGLTSPWPQSPLGGQCLLER